MKRYAISTVFLLAVVGVITGVFAAIRRDQEMAVRLNKRDLPRQGVHLITLADPQFEQTASSYFKNRPPELFQNPSSVFIKNSGDKSIVAYMLVWQLVTSDGQIRTNRTAYSEPGVLMGNPKPLDPSFKHTRAIEPNGLKCFSWAAAIDAEGPSIGGGDAMTKSPHLALDDPSSIRAARNLELAEATSLTVSIDGIFFEDGTFIGPNTTGYFERVQAMVNAKLDLLRHVATASEKGLGNEALDGIEAKGIAPAVTLTSESSADDYYKHYSKMFASEITQMRKAYGIQRLAEHLVNAYQQPRPALKKVLVKGGEPWNERD